MLSMSFGCTLGSLAVAAIDSKWQFFRVDINEMREPTPCSFRFSWPTTAIATERAMVEGPREVCLCKYSIR